MQKKKNNETSNECKTQIVASFNWKRVNVDAKQHEKKNFTIANAYVT